MQANLKGPQLIEKEEIVNLKFPSEEVLASPDDRVIRRTNLEKALKLGNIEHGKIKVIFEDVDGIKQVETTVWGVTDNRIILKQSLVIPIHRVHEVKI